MLDENELGDFIDGHYKERGDTLFRFEGLPLYKVDADGEDYRRWQAGALEPTWDRKQPWLNALRGERERGLVSSRVRLFSHVLTDYELYACHFGYAYNAQFEDIRVLHLAEHSVPDLLHEDYWIINTRYVLPMHYNSAGEFIGAELLEDDAIAPYLADQATAWSAAEPFQQWWSRHTALHRRAA